MGGSGDFPHSVREDERDWLVIVFGSCESDSCDLGEGY
jgi:hypothetical protein